MALLRHICVEGGLHGGGHLHPERQRGVVEHLDEAGLREALERAIADQAGFTPEVMIRTAA